jgi:hypothetical protein
MRSAPHRGFSAAISRIRAARGVGRRPSRRDRRRHDPQSPMRCQRRTVARCTSIVTVRHAGAKRVARATAYRPQGFQRGRVTTFRSATINCCRSRAFSATSVR